MVRLPGKLYTAEQVRRLDACAIGEHDIAGKELMERAGAAAFAMIRDHAPGAMRWLVVCGGGNNGGDGYVVARLALAAGLQVRLLALKEPASLSGDAALAAEAWIEAGGKVAAWGQQQGSDQADLVVDALLGTGLDRAVEGDFAQAIEQINGMSCPRFSIDIPSGLNADSGRALGVAVRAVATISFIGLKRGMFTCDGPDCSGTVYFDDLGVPASIYNTVSNSGNLIDELKVREWLKPRPRNAHKGNFGHVLVVGGQPGMGGAPRLAAEAALRVGAGLVTIATHPDHAALLNLTRPELMVSACATAQDLDRALERATLVAAGPGLGTGDWSRGLLDQCLAFGLPLVVDADALNLLARNTFQAVENCILTPHPAEAARLLALETAEVQEDRVASALALAERYAATVVLKGCGTVIGDSRGRYAICALGNAGMATAGSGDVLTGVIAGLWAQGLPEWQAACLGTAVHAAAGDHAAGRLGERSLIAGDITDHLSAVLR